MEPNFERWFPSGTARALTAPVARSATLARLNGAGGAQVSMSTKTGA